MSCLIARKVFLVLSAFCVCAPLGFSQGDERSGRVGRSYPIEVAETVASGVQDVDTVQAKVVGGRIATEGQFKWQVALILSNADPSNPFGGFFCGGTLINWRWVLTAAHCVHREIRTATGNEVVQIEPGSVHIYLGSVNFVGGERIAVQRIKSHTDYNPKTQDSDVALIELQKEPRDRQHLELAKIGHASSLTEGLRATVVGWGSTARGRMPAEARKSSASLRYVEVLFKNSELCRRYHVSNFRNIVKRSLKRSGTNNSAIDRIVEREYPIGMRIITDNMMCAGTDSGAQDSCFGDSGGPLVVYDQDRWVQRGVVSWGPPEACGMTNLYGVYVDLARYHQWIELEAK